MSRRRQEPKRSSQKNSGAQTTVTLHGLVPMFDRPLGPGIGGWAEGMLEGLLRQLLREDVGDTSCLFGSNRRPYRTEQK